MFSNHNPIILLIKRTLLLQILRLFWGPILPSTENPVSKSSTRQAGDTHGVYKGGGVQEERNGKKKNQKSIKILHLSVLQTCKMIYQMSNATFTNCSEISIMCFDRLVSVAWRQM